MRSVLLWVPCVLLFLALTEVRAAAGPLAKPSAPEARERLTRGNKLYNIRSFDEAIAEYKAGSLIEPAPVFDYNLGQCYRMLGKCEDAIWHYEHFMERSNPQGELLDAVRDFITQMRSDLDRKAMKQKATEPAATAPTNTLAGNGSSPPPASVALVRGSSRAGEDAWYRDRLGWGFTAADVIGLVPGVNYIHPTTTTTSPHRPRSLSDRGSWSSPG